MTDRLEKRLQPTENVVLDVLGGSSQESHGASSVAGPSLFESYIKGEVAFHAHGEVLFGSGQSDLVRGGRKDFCLVYERTSPTRDAPFQSCMCNDPNAGVSCALSND